MRRRYTLSDPLIPNCLASFFATLPLLVALSVTFTRVLVVLAFLRRALGIPRIPPDSLLLVLALLFTSVALGPVLDDCYRNLNRPVALTVEEDEAGEGKGREKRKEKVEYLLLLEAAAPLLEFMKEHSGGEEREFFLGISRKLHGDAADASSPANHLAAFALTELKEAFYIGFMLFLPFLVVDLVVSNSLLAAGLTTISAERVALPFKLLLFLLMNGWELLLEGLLLRWG